jgi:hypothetical protein
MNERDKELAVKCRLLTKHTGGIYTDSLQEFADLIRADEREACAKLVDHILKEGGGTYGDAIKARGNT